MSSPVDTNEFNPEAMSSQGLQNTSLSPVRNPWPGDINWTIVYHRIEHGKEHGSPCKCEDCNEYLAYIHAKYY